MALGDLTALQEWLALEPPSQEIPHVLRAIADIAERTWMAPSIPNPDLGVLGQYEVRSMMVPGTLAFLTYKHTFDLDQEVEEGKDYHCGRVDLLSID